MKWLTDKINDTQLRWKMLIPYVIAVILPMLVILVFFRYRFVDKMESSILEMENAIVVQISNNMENYINNVESITQNVSQSEILGKLLQGTEGSLERMLQRQSEKDAVRTFLEKLNTLTDGQQILGIKIYCNADHPLLKNEFTTQYPFFESEEKINTSLWYGMMQDTGEKSLTASIFYLNSWEIQKLGMVSCINKVSYYCQGQEENAYIAVYFNRDYLSGILDNYKNYNDSELYLIDAKNSLVADALYDETTFQIMDYQDTEKEKIFQKISYGKSAEWILYYDIGNTGWRLILAIPDSAITGDVKKDWYVFMGIYLIIACLICGGMACVSSFTTKRIQKLRDQMEKVKDNLPETLDCKTYKDEIGQLTDSYNYMVKTNRYLVKERNEMTREKNQMEMNVLRSQMNPHFLYNTLDMISWYAAAGSTNDVMDTIQVLASFYKISLNNGKVLTTLEQEIKLLELYMELQNRRSSETIELIVDVPELLLDQEILQFTLQPLVENSLKHGIFEKDVPEGMILITGRLENDEMVLNVEDDGVGMEPEVCQRLFQEKPKEKKKSGHIGVRNIYRRLLLYYGKGNFSMNYKSKIGEGTTVEIRVPCNLKAEEEQDDIGKE